MTEVLYNATVYRDPAGDVAGIFAAARDVTEKNRLQDKLLHAERMEAMSKLTAMIAHDLRNPLSSASQAAEMALIYPDRTTKMLGLIRDSVNRSLNLIEELRSGTREIVLRPEETEITSLIRKVADENPPPQGVKLKVTLPEETGNAKIDSELIHRVFENLTRNAYEAMPGGGELTMSATLNNGDIRIDFSDTGTGIPPEAVSRIFDTFYTTKAKGLGLGLAFSKRAVEAHGGKLTFTTTYGKGTTFTVTLPRETQ